MSDRVLNEDPNQQFEQHRFSYDNERNNSRTSSSSNDEQFPFNPDLFTEDTNDVESDDFYGRTREIIIFAEKGNKSL